MARAAVHPTPISVAGVEAVGTSLVASRCLAKPDTDAVGLRAFHRLGVGIVDGSGGGWTGLVGGRYESA